MKKSFALYLPLFILLFTACEKVIAIDPDPNAARLVLNGVPMADKQAFVYFANTRFFLDTSNNQPIDGASLSLYVNGVPCMLDSVRRCRYYFDYVGMPGDSLRVVGTTPRGEVSARTYIPLVPAISNIRLQGDTGGYSMRYYNADFTFQDHAGVEEFYNLSVSVRDSGIRYNTWTAKFDTVDTVHSSYFTIRYNPEITGNASYTNGMMGLLYNHNYFNDGEIDGRNYRVRMQLLHTIDTNEVLPFKHEYTVSLASITYDRLRYLIEVSRQSSSSSFFSEQGQVEGNVTGALGVFAGAAVSKFTFDPDTLAKRK